MRECCAHLAPEEATRLKLKDCVNNLIQGRRDACSLLPICHVRIILQVTMSLK